MTQREEKDKAEVQVLADRARAAVSALARRVKVLTEKGDRAAEKAEQFYKAAGIHIRQIKEQSLDDWETVVRGQCNIGRSRAYELMAIADGKTTLEKVRASTNERQKIHKAKSQSVNNGRKPDSSLEGAGRVTESAEVSIEDRKVDMARLDEPETVDEVDRRVTCVTNTIQRHIEGLTRIDTERFFEALRDQLDDIEREALQADVDLSIPEFLRRAEVVTSATYPTKLFILSRP